MEPNNSSWGSVIITIIVLVVLGVGGWWLYSRRAQDNTEMERGVGSDMPATGENADGTNESIDGSVEGAVSGDVDYDPSFFGEGK